MIFNGTSSRRLPTDSSNSEALRVPTRSQQNGANRARVPLVLIIVSVNVSHDLRACIVSQPVKQI